MKWILIAALVLVLFKDRIFGRPSTTGAGTVYRPDPLYGPTPAPTYATAPPPPATNVYDAISTGISTLGDVISGWDPFGSPTGDN